MMNIPQDHSIWQRIEAAKRETKSNQAHRLVDYLHVNGTALTADIARDCAIGNISAAANLIRPALQKRGLAIIAQLPDQLIQNRFGEPSMSHTWKLVQLRND